MTVESTGPNKVNEYAQFPEPPETVRANEKDFRWVIGRISCLIRIPIYAVAATFQVAKTALKLSVATVTLGQLYRFEATKNWSLGGVTRDAIGFISIALRIVNSCVCVLFAPPKQYQSLKEGCSRSIDLVFKGSHHEQSGDFSEMEKVKNCWAAETVRANEKEYRWVIGRISSLIRIPIYAVAATFQLAKTALKLSVATVTLGQLYRFEATKNWSLGGVARDAIGFISIAQRIVNSCVCVLFAPPKQYRSLKEVCSRSIGLVFKGSHHEKSGHFSEMEKVKNCWAVFLYSIPAYHKQIFESDSIVNSYATPPEPIDASTASEPDRESSTSESEETRRSSSPPLSDEENPTTAHPVVRRRGDAIPKLDLSQVHDDEREANPPSSISFPPGTPKPEKEIIHSDRLTPRHTAPLSAYSSRTPQQIAKDQIEVRRAALEIVKAG